MNRLKITLLATAALAGVLGATAAQAYPGHFYGPRVGIYVNPWPVVAAPWWGYGYGYNYGYSPYYAYPPVVVTQPAAPVEYVEQTQQAPVQQTQQPQSSDWYYCRKPEGYYPYVRNCSEAWQRVPAQPPAQH